MMRRFFSLLFTLIAALFFLVAPAYAGLNVKRQTTGSLTSGLVGWWTFNGADIAGTTAYDRSGQGNNGSITGATKAIGKLGQGLSFFNSTDRNTLSGISLSTTFTISLWVKFRSFPSAGNWSSLVSQDNYNAFCIDSTPKFDFYYSGDHLANTPLSANTWYHAVLVNNAGNVTFYLNGSADGTAASGVALNLSYIGTDAIQDTLDGILDDVRVYNRALSAGEVKRLYNIGKGALASASQQNKVTTGLVGYWPFNGQDTGPSLSASDSGSGADADPIGGNWSTGDNERWIRRLNNEFNFDAGYDCASYWNAATFDPDQYAQVQFANVSRYSGPAVRLTATQGYVSEVWSTAFGVASYVRIWSAGKGYIGSDIPITLQANDVIKLTAEGTNPTTLRVYQNGNLLGTTVDSTSPYTTGSPGIHGYDAPMYGVINWKGGNLNETAFDRSGQGHNGTMVSSPLKVAGKLGQGLSFNGSTTSVNVGNPSSLQLTGSMTLSAWVKAEAHCSDDCDIAVKYVAGSGGFQLKTTPDTGPRTFGFTVTPNASSATQRYSSATVDLNRWYFVAGVYNASAQTMDIYVDGALNNGTLSGAVPASQFNSNNNVTLGAYPNEDYNRHFNGTIDDVRVYNRALSADEVKRLYNLGGGMRSSASQQNKVTTGLVGYWPFNGKDIAGTTVYDRSGQGHNGTMVSSPLKVAGKIGQGLSFNGGNYVDIPAPGANFSNGYTVHLWIKTDNINGAPVSAFSDGYYGIAYYGWDGDLSEWWGYNTDWTYVNVGMLADNQWHAYACTYDLSYMTSYRDGVQVQQKPYQNLTIGNSPIQIGKDTRGGSYFSGAVDDVRVYNRALSAEEVKRLYNMGR
jgi:hypothetical protein